MNSDLRFRFRPHYRVVWVALALLLVLCLATAPDLFHSASLTLITALAGVLAVASAGQLLVIVSGAIDLSVPAVMTIAGAIVVKQTQGADDRLLVSIVEAAAVGGVVGLLNGVFVSYAKLNSFIVTLAMGGVVAGVTVLWAGTSFSTTGQVPGALIRFTQHDLGPLSLVGLVGLVVLALGGLALRSSRVGHRFLAMGTNRVAAEIIGIRVRIYQVGGFVAAGILYALAGILLSGIVQSPNLTIGDPYQLTTIVAVALGGASLAGGPGSMLCTGAGCLFVGILDEYLAIKNLGAGVAPLVNGLALIVAVAMVTSGTWRRSLHLRWRRRAVAT